MEAGTNTDNMIVTESSAEQNIQPKPNLPTQSTVSTIDKIIRKETKEEVVVKQQELQSDPSSSKGNIQATSTDTITLAVKKKEVVVKKQELQPDPSSSKGNIQSTSTADVKKQEEELLQENLLKDKLLKEKISNDLRYVAQCWLNSWYDKKQWYHMNNRPFWERVYRGVFWLAQNPYIPERVSFIKENDDITLINGSFITCPRLMDYIVYFMELILHPEMLDLPITAAATEDVVHSILSKEKCMNVISTFMGSINKIYQEAIKEDVQDLQRIKERSIKNLLYAFVTLFEPRPDSILKSDKLTNESLINDWNKVFLSIKKSLDNVSTDEIGWTELLKQIELFQSINNEDDDMKKNGDAATADNDAMEDNNNNTTKNKKKVTMLKVTGGPHPGFRGIIEKEPEYCTVSENNTGFSNWTMPEEERGPSQSQDDKSMYIIGHTKIITASILDVARNIAKGIPHIEEPLLILRESFERFHGGFDPFYIQLLRSQLKMVFSKDNSTIIFDSFAYKCVIDTFSDMYDEFDPAIVDKIDFESDGFVFNLEYIHAFLKEIFPVHAELTKKMQTSIEMKNMFDFTFDDGAFTIHVENFAYYKVDGFPLYNDKGEVLISATDISCHLTLSILNNEVRVEYCKCKIGTLNVQFYESTKTSLVNLLVKQTLKKVMRRKLQESLEQVLTITFTNIFL